jgi:hypothetical protein
MPALNLTMMQSIARSKFQSAVLPAGASRDDYFAYLDAVCLALEQAFEVWRSSASLAASSSTARSRPAADSQARSWKG